MEEQRQGKVYGRNQLGKCAQPNGEAKEKQGRVLIWIGTATHREGNEMNGIEKARRIVAGKWRSNVRILPVLLIAWLATAQVDFLLYLLVPVILTALIWRCKGCLGRTKTRKQGMR